MFFSNLEKAEKQTLAISNQSAELARVAEWLEQLSIEFQLNDDIVFKIDLVLNECLINIISYAYRDQAEHTITINFYPDADHVVLEVIDDGFHFNPFTREPLPPQLTLESATPDGRGILLIKSFTDNQEYLRLNNSNIMRVYIKK